MVEIKNVKLQTPSVSVGGVMKLVFEIFGAQAKSFEFPFSNDSLTEPKIEFVREETTNA